MQGEQTIKILTEDWNWVDMKWIKYVSKLNEITMWKDLNSKIKSNFVWPYTFPFKILQKDGLTF